MRQQIMQIGILLVTAAGIVSLILGCHRDNYKPSTLTVKNSQLTLETTN